MQPRRHAAAFRLRRVSAARIPCRAAWPPPPAASLVTVRFTAPDGRFGETTVAPGTPLLDAADAAAAPLGLDVPVGCCTGSCGICEVEVGRRGATDGVSPDGATAVVRACVTAVPAGYASVDLSFVPDDAAWGVDAWDT
jgi:ferredoxin